MKLYLIHDQRALTELNWASKAGHVALDLAGLIPGFGEPADLTNALWYIHEKDYLSAALSLISMIPEIGDLIGKGGKYLAATNKNAGRLVARAMPAIQKYWPSILEMVKQSQKLKPYARKLDDAVNQWFEEKSVPSSTSDGQGRRLA